MDISEYQDKAHSFAAYGNNPMYPLLGLAEESGEACGKVSKFIRGHDGIKPNAKNTVFSSDFPDGWNEDNKEFLRNFSKELGDVLWMVSECCTVFGFRLEDVMEENIAKLEDRQSRGVIAGEGDNR